MSLSPAAVIVAGTFSIDFLGQPLQFWSETLGDPFEPRLAPYAQFMEQLLNPQSEFSQNTRGVNVLLVRMADCIRDLPRSVSIATAAHHMEMTTAEWLRGVATQCGRSATPLIVFCGPSSCDSPTADLEHVAAERFLRALRVIPGVHCLQHADVVEPYPVESYFDAEADRLAHIPYTEDYFIAIATLLVRRITRMLTPPHKAIVLDCDNTLWQGVCAETDARELRLTPCHITFQRLLVAHQAAGVLLCLCSKNDVADVERVFTLREDMPLKFSHIVSHRVNWDKKSANVLSLSKELSLGMDSFIFIDDNPAECAEVHSRCPGILTLQIPADGAQFQNFLRHIWDLDPPPAATAEARQRNFRYQENKMRLAAMTEATDFLDFLRGLKLRVTVSAMEPAHLDRVAELVVRTNQFNTTTVRRSRAEVAALAQESDFHVKVIHVDDRFGDYGLTGVVILRALADVADVDTLLLSCRVLGRGVEAAVVRQLAVWASSRQLRYIQFEYRPTQRNTPARKFLQAAFQPFEVARGEVAAYKVPVEYALNVENIHIQAPLSVESEQDRLSAAPTNSLRYENVRTTQLLNSVAVIRDAVARYASQIRLRDAQSTEQRANVRSGDSFECPVGVVEQSLAHILCKLLMLPTIGRSDNFVELGGDSLLAVKLVGHIRKRFAVQLSIGAVLQCRSLTDMSLLIESLRMESVASSAGELEGGVV